MVPAKGLRTPGRRLRVLFAAALALAAWLAVQPVGAQEEGKGKGDVRTDSALAFVPADTAFYAAMLRNKEQIDIVLKSNAYKRLRALPGVQKGLKELQEKMKSEPQFNAAMKMLQTEENKAATDVVVDALSHEIFVYGGAAWSDLLATVLKANSDSSFASTEAMVTGGDPSKAQLRAVLKSLQKGRDKLKVPELVVGFKVSDPKKAQEQLGRLGELLEQLVGFVPDLKGRFKKGANNVYTLELASSMIPWDDINLKDYEEKAGEFNDLEKTLKGLKATVSLGVKGNYVLLGFTSEGKDLDRLGAKGKTLGQVDTFKRIDKHARERVTGVSYTSKAFLTALQAGNDMTETSASLKRMLEKADLPAARRKAIEKDLDSMLEEVKGLTPKVGASVDVSYIVSDGLEGYTYTEGDHSRLKGVTSKLPVHFGGDPIFAAGVGFKVDGKGYETFVKFLTAAYTHGEAIALEKAPDEARGEYKKFSKVFFPLVQKLNDTTRKTLLPSLKDGGLGLVIDAKWKSKQWLKIWEQPRPLPLPEIGLLVGVSDGEIFAKAMKEYRVTLNELYEKVREVSKENVPEFKIPAPESSKVKSGTLYFYPIPEGSGIDKQFLPTAGVGGNAAALALSKEHATRLITATPLKAGSGPLARKNVIGGCYFNFPALLDAIDPWLDLAPLAVPADDKEAKAQATQAAKEAKMAIDILKAFQGFQSATFLQEDVVVTHSKVTIKDR